MTHYSDIEPPLPPENPPVGPRFSIPLSKPFITYILLGAIIAVYLISEVTGDFLFNFGANYGPGVILNGEIWRLFTSMFLHAGLTHLFFNAYALFIFGLEMERIYGPDRYVVIYVLAGLFGSLASVASKGNVLSVGASGAIFGVIGMNLAYFLLHRKTFGEFGRSRVSSTLVIIGINIFLGLSISRIDNMAHMGGLVAGFLLGYALAPRYQMQDEYTLNPRVVDTVSLLNRWWAPALAIVILAGGLSLTISFWASRL